MKHQETVFIFSYEQPNLTTDEQALQKVRSECVTLLNRLVEMDHLWGYSTATGCYEYDDGTVAEEESFICVINFQNEQVALSILKEYAFNRLHQESVAIVDYQKDIDILYASGRTESLGKLVEGRGNSYTILPSGTSFTNRLDG